MVDTAMNQRRCKLCDNPVEASDDQCPHCGMPLPPDSGNSPQKTFILYFIGIVIFCIIMILWLPPDWTRFLEH